MTSHAAMKAYVYDTVLYGTTLPVFMPQMEALLKEPLQETNVLQLILIF